MNNLQDGQLLADVALHSSQTAFEELVRRHAPMVYHECRRLLADAHEAEDAAQAVFFVLWKKAGSLRKRSTVAGWLHEVARNVCRNLKRARKVRKLHELQAAEMHPQAANSDASVNEIRDILDEDLSRLLDKYRLPIILFHLEGRSLDEIAALLGTTTSTIGTRLSRGRELLKSRLVRRGIEVSGAALMAALAVDASSAALPASFLAATTQCASLFAVGSAAGTGALSTQVAALANGIIHSLAIAKLKLVAAVLIAATMVGGGTLAVVQVIRADDVPAVPQPTPLLVRVARPIVVAAVEPNAANDNKGPNDARPLHNDPKMAEIIRQMQQNEERYKDLETVVRFESRLVNADNPKFWSVTEIRDRRRTVCQGELYYYEGSEQQTTRNKQTIRNERIAAYDGEKTRSFEVGKSANIYLGRHESPYVSPPHTWAVSIPYVNFPLSTLLQGTDALSKHPKVHRYLREGGSFFEFTFVDTSFEGDETIDGLQCIRIRCDRWSGDSAMTNRLWLAPERNYLCVKSQVMSSNGPLMFEIKVDEFREAAPGMWLPARVTTSRMDRDALEKQTTEWTDTLVLETAVVGPKHPIGFFRDIRIPPELPVYTIANGRLADGGLESAEPAADSANRIKKLIAKLQTNEQLYANLDVELEKLYRVFDSPISYRGGTAFSIASTKTTTLERSHQQRGKFAYSDETVVEMEDGSGDQSNTVEGFDGEWTRTLRTSSSTRNGQSKPSMGANIQKGGNDVPVHRPHVSALRYDTFDSRFRPLSTLLSGGKSSPQSDYYFSAEWLGEVERDGLHCDVVRLKQRDDNPETGSELFFLLWLARERNLLPVRCEYYDAQFSSKTLPAAVTTIDDLREIRPGVWFPFDVKTNVLHSWQSWAPADVSVDEMVVQRRIRYVINKAVLDSAERLDLSAGPTVPADTKVGVLDENRRRIGEYLQEKDGPITIEEDRYREMLNEAKTKPKSQTPKRKKSR